ncbi:PREDICTED: uncharacterized protein LOC104724220 [Camelina sativa]|uniref:Uncharacterized protein LOC104724220 n=1 Tax=Camelina sativa TaxID=90675 RepID=A0ABM0UGW6_CAMSA|nr:PREDICTED: uncharacterized protein LOC104724220 [Camelina sativa]XP_010440979.1 PREDICTED: uncharacterized protein LOC104724220 [Camelina sativa]XP_010440980.1 PREDICTED: uncharacterized protein LOC104724220 [Camelina sativa]
MTPTTPSSHRRRLSRSCSRSSKVQELLMGLQELTPAATDVSWYILRENQDNLGPYTFSELCVSLFFFDFSLFLRVVEMSSSSETSVVASFDRGVPSKCVCGASVMIFTSRSEKNPGRPFFRCITKRDPSSWTNKSDVTCLIGSRMLCMRKFKMHYRN